MYGDVLKAYWEVARKWFESVELPDLYSGLLAQIQVKQSLGDYSSVYVRRYCELQRTGFAADPWKEVVHTDWKVKNWKQRDDVCEPERFWGKPISLKDVTHFETDWHALEESYKDPIERALDRLVSARVPAAVPDASRISIDGTTYSVSVKVLSGGQHVSSHELCWTGSNWDLLINDNDLNVYVETAREIFDAFLGSDDDAARETDQ